MKKILTAVGNHFISPVLPLLKLMFVVPYLVKKISMGAFNEFERVLKIATGTSK